MTSSSELKKREQNRFAPMAWALIRVWMGIFFLTVGMVQLPGQYEASVISGLIQNAGMVGVEQFHKLSLGGFMPILLVVIGLLLIGGALTPYAAIAGLAITAWAFLPGGLDLISIGTTVTILMLAIILAKAGRSFGMDALLHERIRLPLM